MKQNYQLMLEETINQLQEQQSVPSLLLHSCCAPCSSYVLEYLSSFFSITVFYYNPNIYPEEEYHHRVAEQQRFVQEFPAKHPISFVAGTYDTERFYEVTKGMEHLAEGKERCHACFLLRLQETAKMAKKMNADYMTTTLSISPRKDAQVLNEIGSRVANEAGIAYLYSDFKKKGGFLRSVELSEEYGMYRQDYCGCVYSYEQRQRQKEEQNHGTIVGR